MERLLRRYGFAALVLGALACACYLAGSTTVPDPVPDFALRAEEIYRLEIGGAFFVAFYLATMAFVLALSGRGFAEVGTQGLKAQEVVDRQSGERQQEAISEQRKFDRRMREKLEEMTFAIDDVEDELSSHEQRLERLEEKL